MPGGTQVDEHRYRQVLTGRGSAYGQSMEISMDVCTHMLVGTHIGYISYNILVMTN